MRDDYYDDISKIQVPETDLLHVSTDTTIVARKPKKGEWFRTSPAHKPAVFFIYEEDKAIRKDYLLLPQVAANPIIKSVTKKRIIYVAVNRDKEVFLSMVGVGDDTWSTSARLGHQQAMTEWVRLCSNRLTKCYEIFRGAAFTDKPEFPDMPYLEMLKAAFGAATIANLEHPVAMELLGKRAETD